MELKLHIEQLLTERKILIEYMKVKMAIEDWHGTQDAASDLRDLDNALEILHLFPQRIILDEDLRFRKMIINEKGKVQFINKTPEPTNI